ncbi:hypothetical protein PGQ11_011977 [Apiospora arundinis]|uniref:Ankyrin repeat protein n=1 Tax=Apiospora arundinis TaxID=335852 RepID=A0ABR2I146_9PEZI
MGKETEPMPEELSDLLEDPIALHHLAQEPRDPDEKVAWAKVLIEAGHDVNKLDEKPYIISNWGRPLHWALEWTGEKEGDRAGTLRFLQCLLDHGADPRLKCCQNKVSALDVARVNCRGWTESETGRELLKPGYLMMLDKARELDAKEARERVRSPGDPNGKLEEEKKREVECKHCRDRKMHNWHYYCYTDTGEEFRNRTERNDCERQDGPVPKGGFVSEPPGFGKFSTVDEDNYDPLTLMERLKYSAQNVFTGK